MLHITIYGERVTDAGRNRCGAPVEPPPRFIGEDYTDEIRQARADGNLCRDCDTGRGVTAWHYGYADVEAIDNGA